MNLSELLQHHERPAESGVPEWLVGCFRRRCISFSDGTSDRRTVVYWLQSRNLTIDLRLPIPAGQVPAATAYNHDQWRTMADYEGWIANSQWDGQRLRWDNPTSLQLHDRWPEPAELRRTGNCMIEFAPSGAYVEDWRLQACAPGPLVGLRLLAERDLATGTVRRHGGGLLICGHYAGLVLGRQQPPSPGQDDLPTRIRHGEDPRPLLDFETSIATGDPINGFAIAHSTRPERLGEALCPLDGFAVPSTEGTLRQDCLVGGREVQRLWQIDTLEKQFDYRLLTSQDAAASTWLKREARTLQRYTEPYF